MEWKDGKGEGRVTSTICEVMPATLAFEYERPNGRATGT